MANYTPIFEKPYPNGYEDLPSETTPVTAQTFNDKDDAIVNIETYLEENPIGEGGASALVDLTDVDVSTVEDGQILKYNAETEMWENADGGGGGSANVWEGSHAEYEEEKSQIADETTLLFNDDIGLEAESDYYSEVEQVIGTYLGKPLYRKVFNLPDGLTLTPNTWTSIGIPSSSFDSFINSKVINSTDGTKCDVFCAKVNNFVTILSTRSTNITLNANAKVIIEYTKTTDSVVGVVGGIKKGDNYSTTEQVIGTWIDGQILYKRTVVVDAPINGLNALNINEHLYIVNFYGGFVSKTSYNMWSLFSRPTESNNKLGVDSVGYDSSNGMYAECEIGTNRTTASKLVLTIEYVKDVQI